MSKQIYVINDFSGSMNTEADPSDIQDNECLFNVNMHARGPGILECNRDRCVVKAGYESDKTLAGTTSFHSAFGFKDNIDQFITALYTNDHYVVKMVSTQPFDLGSPVLHSDKIKASEIAQFVTRANYILHNNILRIGTADYYGAPITIVPFGKKIGASYVVRSRFVDIDHDYDLGASSSCDGIGVFNDYYYGGSSYANRGCGIYLPIVESVTSNGTANGFTYDSHSIGIYIRQSGSASGSSLYYNGDKIYYGFTFEYDFCQESPMSVLGHSGLPTITITVDQCYPIMDIFVSNGTPPSNPGWWPNLYNTSNNPIFDERISAINIYRKINDGEWYHLYKIDIGNGVICDNSDQIHTWNHFTNFCSVQNIVDYGLYRVETYYSRTGFKDYLEYNFDTPPGTSGPSPLSHKTNFLFNKTSISWDVGCIFRDMAVVQATRYTEYGNSVFRPHKRIYVSFPGKADLFHYDNWIEIGTKETSRFRAIQPLGNNRIVLWDDNYTYILNASSSEMLSWYLEKEYNLGIASGNAFAIVKDGIIFGNKSGCYYINYAGDIVELSRKIRTEWQHEYMAHSSMLFYYDNKKDTLYILRTGRSSHQAGLQFDLETGVWSWWSDYSGNSLVAVAMGVLSGYDGEMNIVYISEAGTKVKTYTVKSDYNFVPIHSLYKTKFFDLGSTAEYKTGKHLYIKYRTNSSISCSVYVYFDNNPDATIISILPASSSVTVGKVRIPYRFRTISIMVAVDFNTSIFELYEIAIEYKPMRPKL